MEKYATYDVFENVITKEIKRVPHNGDTEKEMQKIAASNEWKKLESDPDDEDV
jgi:hypothetical protein